MEYNLYVGAKADNYPKMNKNGGLSTKMSTICTLKVDKSPK